MGPSNDMFGGCESKVWHLVGDRHVVWDSSWRDLQPNLRRSKSL